MKLLSGTLLAAVLILTGLFVHRDQESDTLNDQTRTGVAGSFVRLPHGTVHYQLAGPERGRTVVLVHGFSVPYYIWDPTYDELVKKGFRVLRYDLYGRGYSDRPDEVYGPDEIRHAYYHTVSAQALAAIFDMVREVNAAADDGKLLRDDVAELQRALQQFDEIFAVLKDDDADKAKQVLEWARAEGKLGESTSAEPLLTDAQVDALIEQRQQARKSRDFARADAIRKQLADVGIILEDTKDGLRWKRK